MIRTLVMLCCLMPLAIATETPAAEVEITPDVVYGHKDGLAMTFDVFQPKQDANGAGVLFMVSGGWYSNWVPPQVLVARFEPLTSRGFTVFAVRHGSSPRYGIPDAVADVRRAVRYIRGNAERFQIDPDRIGVFGMSAGGHLSLMLGTTADDGKADANDAVLRVSDRVQAVVAFVAPTDLTIMVKDAPDRLPAYERFPALQLDMDNAKSNSPLLHVTPDDAPTLLLAGVKDDLVPVDHSRRIKKSLDDQKVACELIEYPNAGHGFGADDMKKALGETVAWFERFLAPK
jgi:acetyl esterase/lipase